VNCITIRISFVNGVTEDYPIHRPDGDWRYSDPAEGFQRLIVRPWGKSGDARHEVPLCNVQSVMVLGLNGADEPPDEEPF
jgi:hypothetical protein